MAKAKIDAMSTISVGVPVGEQLVSTVCPHCAHILTVLLASSPQEADTLKQLQERLATAAQAPTPDTTARTPRPERRQVSTKRTHASAREMAVLLRPRAQAPAPPPMTPRPRFRYYAVDRRKNPILSESRRKVYALAVKAGKNGIIEQDARKKNIPHGTFQQTMHWLRNAGLVRVEEETPEVD